MSKFIDCVSGTLIYYVKIYTDELLKKINVINL